ncbi:MAG: pilus (MSHA type) biogenesis protein MshL [Magnetococcales bacterium]|nr:pilus (MSHA type) biogenesis protein MshL [Magnetococcales bacterium]
MKRHTLPGDSLLKIWRQMPSSWKMTGVGMACALLAACSNTGQISPSKQHFLRPTNPPVSASMDMGSNLGALPTPDQVGDLDEQEVYTITVTDMSVRDLLFALARDANMNVDIYPGIQGRVTLSAIEQSLPEILDRIAKQVDLSYEINGSTISISPNRPFLKVYQVDYVNMSRTTTSTNKISTQISTQNLTDTTISTEDSDKNQSQMELSTTSNNQFWESLQSDIQAILLMANQTAAQNGGTDLTGQPAVGGLPAGDSAASAAGAGGATAGSRIVSVNREAGLLSIYAKADQHKRVKRLLDSILDNVHRQVMIESTVVEVTLSDRFQGGVDWSNLTTSALGIARAGNSAVSALVGLNALNPLALQPLRAVGDLPAYTIPFHMSGHNGRHSIEATVRALKQFGNTKVLSSPKIMALNNQTAVLKVVNNRVFFTVESQTDSNNNRNVNTQIHTVPVGLVMSVMPQIGADDIVTLNVRPTISSISSWVNDPNPELGAAINRIPEIQVKEMESILRVHSGQVAILGGLMQDRISKSNAGLPGLSKLPLVGDLFQYKDDSVTKTELVLFIRPIVMTHNKERDPRKAAAAYRKRQDHNRIMAPAGRDGHYPPGVGGQQRMTPHGTAPSANSAQPTSYLDFTSPAALPPSQRSQSGAGMVPQPQEQGMMNQNRPLQGMTPHQGRYAPAPTGGGAPGMGAAVAPNQLEGSQSAQQQSAPVTGSYYVDLGSFSQTGNANAIHQQAAQVGYPVYQEMANVRGKQYTRVRSGPFQSQHQAVQASRHIAQTTGITAKVGSY